MIIRMLLALGFRRWRDIDFDEGWTLQQCAWSGERRTVVYGYNIRAIKPHCSPRWESQP